MKSTRPFLRALALLFAVTQLAASGLAPALEAFASARDDTPWSDTSGLRGAPQHSHDASTCPVCRLIDSPARVEAAREMTRHARNYEREAVIVRTLAAQLAETGFLSRAPPATAG